jgi:hypothetical protein
MQAITSALPWCCRHLLNLSVWGNPYRAPVAPLGHRMPSRPVLSDGFARCFLQRTVNQLVLLRQDAADVDL